MPAFTHGRPRGAAADPASSATSASSTPTTSRRWSDRWAAASPGWRSGRWACSPSRSTSTRWSRRAAPSDGRGWCRPSRRCRATSGAGTRWLWPSRLLLADRARRRPEGQRAGRGRGGHRGHGRGLRRHRQLHPAEPVAEPVGAQPSSSTTSRPGRWRSSPRTAAASSRRSATRCCSWPTTPESIAQIGLELVEERQRDEDFPELRVGLAWGPAVARLGDVLGPVVNVASRLTSTSRPGRVLGTARSPTSSRTTSTSSCAGCGVRRCSGYRQPRALVAAPRRRRGPEIAEDGTCPDRLAFLHQQARASAGSSTRWTRSRTAVRRRGRSTSGHAGSSRVQ